jgi:L-serine kinase (ATP) / ParB family transcriptional regulator, heme-responsive regulator
VSEPFDLRVVSLAQVIPHEASEPRRVERMVKRLVADDWLGNPPIVLPVAADLGSDGFVLIDGANRIAALRELGYPHAIVQVASTSTVRLATWYHVLLDTTPDLLLDALRGVTTVELGLPSDGAACTVSLADGRSLGVRPRPGTHPFTALHPLVACYLRQAVVRRATEPDLAAFPDAAALVGFGRLTIDDVLGAVRDGALLPAGITRFVIPGRVLSLNAPLAPLRAEPSTAALNQWLTDLVASRRAEGRVRHYPEPVFVFDD